MQPSLTPQHAGLQRANSKLGVHVAIETRNTPRNILYKKAYERAEGKKQRNLYSTPKKGVVHVGHWSFFVKLQHYNCHTSAKATCDNKTK